MKELLSRAGVPFEVRNVETDLEAYRDLIARGFRTVPVTVIGTDPPVGIPGFDEPAITRALGL
ncbi:MAG TPA: glutaredoxin domain-containing protein [Vicinamibacterales bacterium]|nr:glutaredoxin domain-containing protein [Vicinamibacterales bacterium]